MHLKNYKCSINTIKMKSYREIAKKVEETFQVLDSIEEVQVNHFFKHKVLKQLETQKEEKSHIFAWITPQLQLATLGLILLLNLSAVFYAYAPQEESSNSTLETFAKEYALQSETYTILN